MFELGRWREPTPIFNGSGHSARKKKSAGIPNSGHTCGLLSESKIRLTSCFYWSFSKTDSVVVTRES